MTISVKDLTAQADAVRRPIHQFREQVQGLQGQQRTALRSEAGFDKLTQTVTDELTDLAVVMQQVGIDPQDALRKAGIKSN